MKKQLLTNCILSLVICGALWIICPVSSLAVSAATGEPGAVSELSVEIPAPSGQEGDLPAASPDGAKGLTVKGNGSENLGAIKVMKGYQAVFADGFKNSSQEDDTYGYIENLGMIAMEGTFTNELGYIQNNGVIEAENFANTIAGTVVSDEENGRFNAKTVDCSGGSISLDGGYSWSSYFTAFEMYEGKISEFHQGSYSRVRLYGGAISECTVSDEEDARYMYTWIHNGSIAKYNQKAGYTNMRGGTIDCYVQEEGEAFIGDPDYGDWEPHISNYIQTGGEANVSELATVSDGCEIRGGLFNMSGGMLKAGSAQAALTVNIPEGAGGEVLIKGGTVYGDIAGKAAILAKSGNIEIEGATAEESPSDSQTVVKAHTILDTFRSGGTDWKVKMHLGGQVYEADDTASLYVGKKGADGLMCLSCIRGSEDFVTLLGDADAGNVIALKDDVRIQPPDGQIIRIPLEAKTSVDLNTRSVELNDIGLEIEGELQIYNGNLHAYRISVKQTGTARIEDCERLSVDDGLVNDGNLEINRCGINGEIDQLDGKTVITNNESNVSNVYIDIDNGEFYLNGGTYRCDKDVKNEIVSIGTIQRDDSAKMDHTKMVIGGGAVLLAEGIRKDIVSIQSGPSDTKMEVVINDAELINTTIGDPANGTSNGTAVCDESVESAEYSITIGEGALISTRDVWALRLAGFERENGGKSKVNLNGGKISVTGDSEEPMPAIVFMERDGVTVCDISEPIMTELVPKGETPIWTFDQEGKNKKEYKVEDGKMVEISGSPNAVDSFMEEVDGSKNSAEAPIEPPLETDAADKSEAVEEAEDKTAGESGEAEEPEDASPDTKEPSESEQPGEPEDNSSDAKEPSGAEESEEPGEAEKPEEPGDVKEPGESGEVEEPEDASSDIKEPSEAEEPGNPVKWEEPGEAILPEDSGDRKDPDIEGEGDDTVQDKGESVKGETTEEGTE